MDGATTLTPGYAFSDYIVFVDESGDHGLMTIDPDYPLFVLALCVFQKQDYIQSICPSMQRLKFRHWGHDSVVLHEHEIRKPRDSFGFLVNPGRRQIFMDDLNVLIETSPFMLIASIVHKIELTQAGSLPGNPYHLALEFGLDRLYSMLEERGQVSRITHVVFESRGRREDAELELQFRQICNGGNGRKSRLPFEIVMSPKSSNATGMQLADLVARPIGISALRPNQPNRAYQILTKKFCRGRNGEIHGWGVKSIP